MTTKKLISKAYEIASKYFDVNNITFCQKLVFPINEYRISLKCFYTYTEYCMYEAEIVCNEEGFLTKELLKSFKSATKKEHQRYFPQKPGTTDLTIEL